MEELNPYQAPSADLSASVPAAPGAGYTPQMLQYLRETKPWVRLLSILGFIFTGFMILAGLLMAIGGAVAGEAFGAFGLIYLVIAGLFLLPQIQLHQYANAIGRALRGGGSPAVEEALLRQRTFWRTTGIMSLVVIGMYVLGIVAVVIAGMMSAMSGI